ncbi:quinone-dependent dihydroorotate dehydrogenase [Hamadaea tsunoensis]|uniref:quinone-dependent dihydroorotate dehydrogenase n=1 Tax=Hamadaea tsunoensis TaxID=53368 RepID=UPI0004040DFF|nr:quinone-dependent dihydroorotate dehydrogenase [Hamadaea tsunoensis]
MSFFENFVRPALFRIGGGDAEAAHEATLHRLAGVAPRPRVLESLRKRYAVAAPRTVFGVDFPNPVGLAAGMDKNGVALAAWPALGFGFVEVGTVTAQGQPGNEKPRLFRGQASEAVVNRMGFNNEGAAALAERLNTLLGEPARRPGVPDTAATLLRHRTAAGHAPMAGALGLRAPLGISLGKTKLAPLNDAVGDYVTSLRMLRPYADYVAINVSSPNTPGLRELQGRGHLNDLLQALVAEAAGTPVLVKIAPDLTDPQIDEVLQVCSDQGVAGLIATNTTLARDGLDPADAQLAQEAGGLSGRPLTERARKVVSFVHQETGGRLPIIGVGGIMSADDAERMFDAGASLVQLYSGFIFHGPSLVRAIAAAGR